MGDRTSSVFGGNYFTSNGDDYNGGPTFEFETNVRLVANSRRTNNWSDGGRIGRTLNSPVRGSLSDIRTFVIHRLVKSNRRLRGKAHGS